MIDQVRIITNQKWIKIRFNARQLGVFLSQHLRNRQHYLSYSHLDSIEKIETNI